MEVFYTLHIKEAGRILHIYKDICEFTLNHPPKQKQVENKKNNYQTSGVCRSHLTTIQEKGESL